MEEIVIDGSVVHSTKNLLFSVVLKEVHVSILFRFRQSSFLNWISPLADENVEAQQK